MRALAILGVVLAVSGWWLAGVLLGARWSR